MKNDVIRITNTVLLYAVRDGATQVRLRAGVGVQVHYLIGDEWHEQMRVPAYVWDALRPYLLEQSDSWKRPILFDVKGTRFEFAPEFKNDFPLQTLTLSLRN